jgi:hypothetical protein
MRLGVARVQLQCCLQVLLTLIESARHQANERQLFQRDVVRFVLRNHRAITLLSAGYVAGSMLRQG